MQVTSNAAMEMRSKEIMQKKLPTLSNIATSQTRK